MKISEGVEWSVHACGVLAALPEGMGLRAAALAAFHELPQAYMAKHLQTLTRAGILMSVRGVQGGYRLARPADQIDLWQIRCAIEGPEPDFRCAEIRRKGPCATRPPWGGPCPIAAAFWAAEAAYRKQLSKTTVADIAAAVAREYGPAGIKRFRDWALTAAR